MHRESCIMETALRAIADGRENPVTIASAALRDVRNFRAQFTIDSVMEETKQEGKVAGLLLILAIGITLGFLLAHALRVAGVL